MKRTILFTAALATAGGLLAAGAMASEDRTRATATAAQGAWMSIPDVIARLDADGYRDIREIEREYGRYEVEATDANGRRVEVYLDGRTGEMLGIEREDRD